MNKISKRKFNSLIKDIREIALSAKKSTICTECKGELRDPNPGELSLNEDIVGVCKKCRAHYIVDEEGSLFLGIPTKEFDKIN